MGTRTQTVIAGIDVGGTKIRWTFLVRADAPSAHDAPAREWRTASSHELSTPRTRKAFVRALHTIIAIAKHKGAASVGIGIAGTLSRGVILRSPHLPFLKGFALADALREHTSLPCAIDNDARCAARAEAAIAPHVRSRSAAPPPVILVATLGTGVGRAVVQGHALRTAARLENAEPWEPGYRRLAAPARPSPALLAEFLGPRLARLAASHGAMTIVLGGGRLRTQGLFARIRRECLRAGFSGTIRRSHFRQNEGAIRAALLGIAPRH